MISFLKVECYICSTEPSYVVNQYCRLLRQVKVVKVKVTNKGRCGAIPAQIHLKSKGLQTVYNFLMVTLLCTKYAYIHIF